MAPPGVYKMERVRDIPPAAAAEVLREGPGRPGGPRPRARPTSVSQVTFAQLNLLEIGDLGKRFAFIFCRNVMIYFDRTVQQRVVTMLERHLAPGGYLFISHSESLNGITHGLKWVAPAVYRRREA